jgi:hypothetical protein
MLMSIAPSIIATQHFEFAIVDCELAIDEDLIMN